MSGGSGQKHTVSEKEWWRKGNVHRLLPVCHKQMRDCHTYDELTHLFLERIEIAKNNGYAIPTLPAIESSAVLFAYTTTAPLQSPHSITRQLTHMVAKCAEGSKEESTLVLMGEYD